MRTRQKATKSLEQLDAVERTQFVELEQLPNVGPAIANDLRLLGLSRPADLIGKDAYQLHDELCRVTGERHDPCVIDVFLAAVAFMEGGSARPWWDFTADRKLRMATISKRKEIA